MLTHPDTIGGANVMHLDLARDGRPLADQLSDVGMHVQDFIADPEALLREARRWRKIEEAARKAHDAAMRAAIAAMTEDEYRAAVERGRARWQQWAEDERDARHTA